MHRAILYISYGLLRCLTQLSQSCRHSHSRLLLKQGASCSCRFASGCLRKRHCKQAICAATRRAYSAKKRQYLHPPVRQKADNIYCRLNIYSSRTDFIIRHMPFVSAFFNFGKTCAETAYNTFGRYVQENTFAKRSGAKVQSML